MLGYGHSAPGGRSFYTGTDTSGVIRVGIMCVLPRNNHEATRSFREALKEGTGSLNKYIAKHYTGVGWKWNDVAKDMFEADDFYGSEIVQVKIPTLFKGRSVLAMPAMHPPY